MPYIKYSIASGCYNIPFIVTSCSGDTQRWREDGIRPTSIYDIQTVSTRNNKITIY